QRQRGNRKEAVKRDLRELDSGELRGVTQGGLRGAFGCEEWMSRLYSQPRSHFDHRPMVVGMCCGLAVDRQAGRVIFDGHHNLQVPEFSRSRFLKPTSSFHEIVIRMSPAENHGSRDGDMQRNPAPLPAPPEHEYPQGGQERSGCLPKCTS